MPNIQPAKGTMDTGIFSGPNGVAIDITSLYIGVTDYVVIITPDGPAGYVGEISVENKAENSFVVKNTGTGAESSTTFTWEVFIGSNGVGTFAGMIGKTIDITSLEMGGSDYHVGITFNGITGYIGEVSVENKAENSFVVKNTGSDASTAFTWMIFTGDIGTGTLSGTSGTSVDISALALSTADYHVCVIPSDLTGYIGEISVDSLAINSFVVKNTGSDVATEFSWSLLPSAVYSDVSFPLDMSAAIAQLRIDLSGTRAKFWPDQILRNYLIRAAIDVSSKTHCVQKTIDIDVVANQLEYNDLSDVLKVLSITYCPDGTGIGARSLRQIPPRLIGHLDMSELGPPHYWYLFSDQIGVWPLSTSTMVGSGDKLKVYYSKATDIISDLPDEFQPLIILYAKYMILQRAHKYGSAAQVMIKYANSVNFCRADLIREIEQNAIH